MSRRTNRHLNWFHKVLPVVSSRYLHVGLLPCYLAVVVPGRAMVHSLATVRVAAWHVKQGKVDWICLECWVDQWQHVMAGCFSLYQGFQVVTILNKTTLAVWTSSRCHAANSPGFDSRESSRVKRRRRHSQKSTCWKLSSILRSTLPNLATRRLPTQQSLTELSLATIAST